MATLNPSPNAYAQQNGGPATSAYVRPQFRRQGSSYGPGHVHNMAVMVAPTKVDYSVTKGGLRLWAVLFVFIFLCSALLTIFSDDSNENYERMSNIAPPDIDEEKVESVKSEEVELPPPAPPDIDEEDDRNEEEILLASLKEKAARRRREKETSTTIDQEVPVPEVKPKERKRRERRKIQEPEEESKIEEEKVEEKIEEEEIPEEEPEVKEVPRKGRKKAQAIVPIEEEVPKKRKQKRRREVQVETEVEEQNDSDQEENQEPEVVHDQEKEPEEELEEDQPQRQARKQKKTAPKSRSVPISRPAVEDDKIPRKNLLKTQKRKILKQPVEIEEEEDDEEENEAENEPNVEVDNEPEVQIKEVVSIRKRTGHYNRKALTNKEDYKHRNKLDLADYLVEKHEFDTALKTYDQVLASYKNSPRARFGRARVMQLQSEFDQEDHYLDQALAEYQLVLDNNDTPPALFRQAAENLIQGARFRGNLHKVMTVQRLLIDRFPDDIELQTDFGLTFLMMGRVHDARKVFENVLELEPNNALALAYYGYILKVYDKQVERGVLAMRRGLRLSGTEIRDSKFYFHLGEGLMRLGRTQEAYKVYEEASELGLFPSMLQRSTYNLDGLTARTWWTMEQSGCGRYLRSLERQWTVIREEAVELWKEHQILFEPEDSHLTDGLQSAFYFMKDSEFNHKNCKLAPNTCNLLKKFVSDANCDKGEIKISVIKAGSRIWPHCGPTNFILEAHLGLLIPSEARIRKEFDDITRSKIDEVQKEEKNGANGANKKEASQFESGFFIR
uniref:Aspartyl/asparaginy/proline hydroxylase domain-containing protein n=1 Tax=Acrobeloides nanus TaxID=290746 RepID=A0A914CCF6_9BILA